MKPETEGKITVPTQTGVVIQTLGDVADDPHNRIAVIGEGGAGKTWLAATSIFDKDKKKLGRVAFIDTDKNIYTLKQDAFQGYLKRNGLPTVDVMKEYLVVQVEDPTDPRTGLFLDATGYWKVLEAVNKLKEDPDVCSIVFDTLTSLSVLATNLGLVLADADGRSNTLKEARNATTKQKGVALLTQADYGAEMNVLEQLFEQLKKIDKMVIMNTHVRVDKNDKGGVVAYMPLITGDKHRQRFGSWFNEVWWLEVSGYGTTATRVLKTQQDSVRKHLKTTSDMPAEITDPTFPKILSYKKR